MSWTNPLSSTFGVLGEKGTHAVIIRPDRHLHDRLSDYSKLPSSSLVPIAFHQASSLQHHQMIDDRLGPDIQPLGHLVEVRRAKREEPKMRLRFRFPGYKSSTGSNIITRLLLYLTLS